MRDGAEYKGGATRIGAAAQAHTPPPWSQSSHSPSSGQVPKQKLCSSKLKAEKGSLYGLVGQEAEAWLLLGVGGVKMLSNRPLCISRAAHIPRGKCCVSRICWRGKVQGAWGESERSYLPRGPDGEPSPAVLSSSGPACLVAAVQTLPQMK